MFYYITSVLPKVLCKAYGLANFYASLMPCTHAAMTIEKVWLCTLVQVCGVRVHREGKLPHSAYSASLVLFKRVWLKTYLVHKGLLPHKPSADKAEIER